MTIISFKIKILFYSNFKNTITENLSNIEQFLDKFYLILDRNEKNTFCLSNFPHFQWYDVQNISLFSHGQVNYFFTIFQNINQFFNVGLENFHLWKRSTFCQLFWTRRHNHFMYLLVTHLFCFFVNDQEKSWSALKMLFYGMIKKTI